MISVSSDEDGQKLRVVLVGDEAVYAKSLEIYNSPVHDTHTSENCIESGSIPHKHEFFFLATIGHQLGVAGSARCPY